MAYDVNGLRSLATSPVQQVFAYESRQDTLLAIEADGYFNQLGSVARPGDIVSIEASDGTDVVRLLIDVTGTTRVESVNLVVLPNGQLAITDAAGNYLTDGAGNILTIGA
jgi:hypothetical protein